MYMLCKKVEYMLRMTNSKNELRYLQAHYSKFLANEKKNLSLFSINVKNNIIILLKNIEYFFKQNVYRKNNIDYNIYNKKSHPLNYITNLTYNILKTLGFDNLKGNEISSVKNNFDYLNIPESHQCRKYQDTFYIENSNLLLRTHTTAEQIRYMKKNYPPYKIMILGKVYRIDSDTTHIPIFHQIEGLAVNRNINIDNLIFCIKTFLEIFFNTNFLNIRLRKSYFPFTEPSFEVDMKIDKWLEVLGCGLIHSDILNNCNINSIHNNGLAFGIGIERLSMLKLNIRDIKDLYDVKS